jgi:hypothetical protein
MNALGAGRVVDGRMGLLRIQVVGPEKVFITQESALEHVRSFLLPGDVDGDDHSENGSETIDPEYWDDLFDCQPDSVTEWLVSYPSIKQYLLPLLQPTHVTLVVGCGNSELSLGLHEDLLDEVTSMDVSQVVIEQVRRHAFLTLSSKGHLFGRSGELALLPPHSSQHSSDAYVSTLAYCA